MNQYQKDLIKFVRTNNDVSIWTLIARELQESNWLDSHQIALVREENKSLPFTLKISLPFGQQKYSSLILSKLSYVLSRVTSNLDGLIDEGYLVSTQQFNLEVPEGETLFKIGNKDEATNHNLIYPDIAITEKIVQKATTIFILSVDAEEFVSQGYKTNEEVKFDKSSNLTQGILKANKLGLGLATITLLLSALSIFSSKKASSNMNSSLDTLNDAAIELRVNLDSINSSFSNVQNLIEILDTSLSKTISTLDDEYDNLNNSINKIDQTIISVAKTSEKLRTSTENFAVTLDKIDYQYSRKPSIQMKLQKCQIKKDTAIAENLILTNIGNMVANLEYVILYLPTDRLLYFDKSKFVHDKSYSSKVYSKFRAKTYNLDLNLLPNQPLVFNGVFKFTTGDKVSYKCFVPYTSVNKDYVANSAEILNCTKK